MNCSRIRRLLSAYYDAELPAERRAAVRRHLHDCEACRTLLEGFKNLAVLTATWTDVQAPASLGHALADKLKAACATIAAEAGSRDPRPAQDPRPAEAGGAGRPAPSAGASPRRTFKPFLEGLEERQTLSGLLCAAGTAIAPELFATAVASLHVDGDWSASSGSVSSTRGRPLGLPQAPAGEAACPTKLTQHPNSSSAADLAGWGAFAGGMCALGDVGGCGAVEC